MPVRGTRVDESGQSAEGVSFWDDRADYQRVWAAARDLTSRRFEKWSERDIAPAGLQAHELSARTTSGGEGDSLLLRRHSFAGSRRAGSEESLILQLGLQRIRAGAKNLYVHFIGRRLRIPLRFCKGNSISRRRPLAGNNSERDLLPLAGLRAENLPDR